MGFPTILFPSINVLFSLSCFDLRGGMADHQVHTTHVVYSEIDGKLVCGGRLVSVPFGWVVNGLTRGPHCKDNGSHFVQLSQSPKP
ncbi:hypothetical protein B0I37DRAFT_55136 [Chaetomium sp. MPI-CAGE-AT-0009]|nr:hypothetical protein B0I37DRAFT_55136 [Chaetomium sp. MPI-CAGE-AT-0009]